MDTELNIVVNAIDESESALAAVADGLDAVSIAGDEMATSLNTTAASVDTSAAEMEASLGTLNEMMTMDADDISEKALAVGVSFDEAAGVVSEAAVEMQLACEAVAASAAEAAAAEAESFGAGFADLKSTAIQAGVVAGIVFVGVKDEITDAADATQKWNQTLSALNTELTNEGSSVSSSAIAQYSQDLSKKIQFSQQDILSADETIAANKSLGESYQSVTMLAANLATVTGITLPQAADILLKAATDPATAVRQLVADHAQLNPVLVTTIERIAQAGDTADATNMIFQALNSTMGGAAENAMKQPGADIEILDNDLQQLQKTIGDAVIPVLDSLAKYIMPIVENINEWVAAHPKLTAAILIGTAALAALAVILAGIVVVVTTVVGSINAFGTMLGAVAASPIALFVVALTGIGAAALILYEAIKTNFGGIKDTIETILTDVGAFIKTWYDKIIGWINDILSAMKSIGSSIGSGIGGAIGGVGNFVTTHLASGGIVSSPTVALIGEAGPEAVIPLSMLGSSDGGAIGGGNNSGINIEISGAIYSSEQQATSLANMIARKINSQLKLRSW